MWAQRSAIRSLKVSKSGAKDGMHIELTGSPLDIALASMTEEELMGMS